MFARFGRALVLQKALVVLQQGLVVENRFRLGLLVGLADVERVLLHFFCAGQKNFSRVFVSHGVLYRVFHHILGVGSSCGQPGHLLCFLLLKQLLLPFLFGGFFLPPPLEFLLVNLRPKHRNKLLGFVFPRHYPQLGVFLVEFFFLPIDDFRRNQHSAFLVLEGDERILICVYFLTSFFLQGFEHSDVGIGLLR